MPLCLSCGLCCDGTLFADVKLTSADAARLAQPPGSVVRGRKYSLRLPQPCFGWIHGKCNIYDSRPDHCRRFDCDLLSRVETRDISSDCALQIIQQCRSKADQVRDLLRALGNASERTPLTQRFRQVTRTLENKKPDRRTRATYGDLSVAMHELHCLLADNIYPV